MGPTIGRRSSILIAVRATGEHEGRPTRRRHGAVGAPLIERQITSLSRRSSAASSFEKSMLRDSPAPQAVWRLRAFRSTLAGCTLSDPGQFGRRVRVGE